MLWQDALVVKVLGKHFEFSFLRQRLKILWGLRSGFEMMSAGNSYYMLKFDMREDRSKVIEGGPWMINGFYLAMKQWFVDVNPSGLCFGRAMV